MLPSVLTAVRDGQKIFFIPVDNIYEVEYIAGIEIYAVSNFSEIVDHFFGTTQISPYDNKDSIDDLYTISGNVETDFEHIK